MSKRKLTIASFYLLPALLACTLPVGAQQRNSTGQTLAQLPVSDWPTSGGDWYNRRYSPLTQIDRSNVANLRGVWRARLDGSGVGTKYSGEAQPIVHDGVIYIVTGADDVFAISVETGERLWKYEAFLDQTIDIVCCGWSSRGVGVGDGKIYVGQIDGQLVALDQGTGQVVWSTQAERWQEGFSITSAPLVYGGLVITGFSGAEYGIRGRSHGRFTRFPDPANSATTLGQLIVMSGWMAAARCGRPPL
jgi:quinohemoprotein ethanol dehydrogenase